MSEPTVITKTLEPADYFHLRAVVAEYRLVELQYREQQRLLTALVAQRDALLRATFGESLARANGAPLTVTWDDATHAFTLTVAGPSSNGHGDTMTRPD